jgi:hypothetical protein
MSTSGNVGSSACERRQRRGLQVESEDITYVSRGIEVQIRFLALLQRHLNVFDGFVELRLVLEPSFFQLRLPRRKSW